MSEYKKFLIQQQLYNGSTYTNVGDVVDTQVSFNVVCQDCPFKYLPESKELAKRDWFDENGEDVYVPTDGLRFKAYDMVVNFLYVGSKENMSQDLNSFINFLYGRNDNGSPFMSLYDEYTNTGRRGIYVKEVNNDLLSYTDNTDGVIASFKVNFRVTDPVTSVILQA